MGQPESAPNVKPKHLDGPLVVGCSIAYKPLHLSYFRLALSHTKNSKYTVKHLLVALQLACRRKSEEAVCPGVVDQRARQQETREEPAERVAVLLEEHQHPVHRLDTQGVVT